MSNNIFLDSSILIEYVKGSKTTLFESLLLKEHLELHYGMPVVSEYLFHYLAILGGKSPLAIIDKRVIKNQNILRKGANFH